MITTVAVTCCFLAVLALVVQLARPRQTAKVFTAYADALEAFMASWRGISKPEQYKKSPSVTRDAVEALRGLGMSKREAAAQADAVYVSGMSEIDVIKAVTRSQVANGRMEAKSCSKVITH